MAVQTTPFNGFKHRRIKEVRLLENGLTRWDIDMWITATEDPRGAKLYKDRKSKAAYREPAAVSAPTPQSLSIAGGLNEGDTIQIVGVGEDITFTYTVPHDTFPLFVVEQLVRLLHANWATEAVFGGEEMDATITLDGGEITGVVYTPNTPNIPADAG